MTTFEELAPEMDDAVDQHLGDTLEYRRDTAWVHPDGRNIAAGEWATITGFVQSENEGTDGYTQLDQMTQRLRLKVQLRVVDFPRATDRVRGARLGLGLFRPASKFDLAGRYWIADLQKASA